MGEFDPVSWAEVEAVSGPPAEDVTPYVEEMADEIADLPPDEAVRTIYDAWKAELGGERSTPDQGAAFVIAYLLEERGQVSNEASWSVADRRPSAERLRELFWDEAETMWWIATRRGVHWALVSYWLWEDDVPLMERNLTAETAERVRALRESDG